MNGPRLTETEGDVRFGVSRPAEKSRPNKGRSTCVPFGSISSLSLTLYTLFSHERTKGRGIEEGEIEWHLRLTSHTVACIGLLLVQ